MHETPLYLVTGGAGFIGSNIAHQLVRDGQRVRVIDDLFNGFRDNLADIADDIELVEASILDESALTEAMSDVDYCLHLAAIGSVPRSIARPLASNAANVEGSMRVFLAARDAGVKRVVASSSSSVYGNNTIFPADEDLPTNPISPYAVSKMAVERYAQVFVELYEIDIAVLRYFNVFGPRQYPHSEYSAVIPKFITRVQNGEKPLIHGDGSQCRDFTFVDNVVHANVLACQPEQPIAGIYNIACGGSTSVRELATIICELMGVPTEFEFLDARPGDIPNSWASIERANAAFGYEPLVSLREGLAKTVEWYETHEVAQS